MPIAPAPTPSENRAVLFVDDEVNILKALTRLLRSEPVRVFTASSATEALDLLERESIQIVVADQRMSGLSGIELLCQVRERWPDVVRILLTASTEMQIVVDAINQAEVFRLLSKPWEDTELVATLRQAHETWRLRAEVDRLGQVTQEQNRELEEKIAERTSELRHKHAELRRAYASTIRALAQAVDAKDSFMQGHSERVAAYALRIARELGCPDSVIERVYLAALLHDIGKIGIPDAILGKKGDLTAEELEVMRHHSLIGARILEPVAFLADVVPSVRHHHEWYDGSDRGYPDQLAGEEIPLASRIILAAETVESMTSDRPYRRAMPLETVIDEIQRFSGRQFDPTVACALLSLIEQAGEGFLETATKIDIESFLTLDEAE